LKVRGVACVSLASATRDVNGCSGSPKVATCRPFLSADENKHRQVTDY